LITQNISKGLRVGTCRVRTASLDGTAGQSRAPCARGRPLDRGARRASWKWRVTRCALAHPTNWRSS
jgi:hypothetical protein